MKSNPEVMVSLAHCMSLVTNSSNCSSALGLQDHPEIVKAKGEDIYHSTNRRTNFYRDPIHSEVIHHADGFSLYTATPPSICLKPSGGGGAIVMDSIVPMGDEMDAEALELGDRQDLNEAAQAGGKMSALLKSTLTQLALVTQKWIQEVIFRQVLQLGPVS